VMSPANDSRDVRGAPPPLQGDKLVQGKVDVNGESRDPCLSLPLPVDPTPPPSWGAGNSSASVFPLLFDVHDVFTSKPPVGRGQLLLRLCRNAGLPGPPGVVKQARDSAWVGNLSCRGNLGLDLRLTLLKQNDIVSL